MTTGAVSYDSYVVGGGSFYGIQGNKTWDGADDPRLPVAKATFYNILREEVDDRTGKTIVRQYRVRQPGWTPKRSHHAEHAFTKQSLRLEHRPFFFTALGQSRADLGIVGVGSWTAVDLMSANDQIRLVNKLSELMQGSEFNFSVFLGEGHQTLRLLADSAVRIRKAFVHARRGDLLGSAQSLLEGTSRRPLAKHDWRTITPNSRGAKNSSSLWLELQYGWLPLLKDAEECAKSLAHALNVPFRQTYRTSVVRATEGPFKSADGAIFGTTARWQQVREHRRSLIARVSEKPSVLAQLGLLDPELVAWELMPFSFVADWFIPIGSWMEARAKASRLTGTFITTDKKTAAVHSLKFDNAPSGGNYRRLLFDRVISTNLKVPFPEFKALEKVASWQHCANAVALLTQIATGGKVRS